MLVLKRDGSSQVAQAVPGVGGEEAGGLGHPILSSALTGQLQHGASQHLHSPMQRLRYALLLSIRLEPSVCRQSAGIGFMLWCMSLDFL